MGNQETALFENLEPLPFPLGHCQCVIHKHEILICGGHTRAACLSYNTQKNQYKRICNYPVRIANDSHCVVKRVNSNNPDDITLLSFGGNKFSGRHTLMMKYVSVWDNLKKADQCFNEWTHLTDNQGKPIFFGEERDNYSGARAVVGGANNNLLFVTYYPKSIEVFDFDTFQLIHFAYLPTNYNFSIHYHFCTAIRPFKHYACVYINDVILFFGGLSQHLRPNNFAINDIFRYSIREDRWTKFERTLPLALCDCVGILNEDNKSVHIIGGSDVDKGIVLAHMKTNVQEWMKGETEKEKQWAVEEEEIRELEEMKNNLQIGRLEKKQETIKMVVEHWFRSSLVNMIWIDDLTKIVSLYVMVYFVDYLCFFIICAQSNTKKKISPKMNTYKH
ncbi:hypothetical protein RFI_12931 [Reticulomyxa filosa]|uniref:Kelch motif family protein n=1 Tax=Reticulomyxa filosa TaxID=46433 RepID=X6NE17_RETFI|nr:hypothetical protein RFI_12931 [Reticulomyxa filosa]|eukprot:ETO24226.1 hypothetical protein RFI_12931 [Reticulomyxa filosa]